MSVGLACVLGHGSYIHNPDINPRVSGDFAIVYDDVASPLFSLKESVRTSTTGWPLAPHRGEHEIRSLQECGDLCADADVGAGIDISIGGAGGGAGGSASGSAGDSDSAGGSAGGSADDSTGDSAGGSACASKIRSPTTGCL